MVLAKPEHENRFSHVFSDSVKTGIANALGLFIAFFPKTFNRKCKASCISYFVVCKKLIMCVYVCLKGIKEQWGCLLCLIEPPLGLSTVT